MRHKKKHIRIEREPRMDPRETHRKHAERYVPPPLREHRNKSQTTEEPSRLPVTAARERGKERPVRHNDMTAAHRHIRSHTRHMARTGRRHRRR